MVHVAWTQVSPSCRDGGGSRDERVDVDAKSEICVEPLSAGGHFVFAELAHILLCDEADEIFLRVEGRNVTFSRNVEK